MKRPTTGKISEAKRRVEAAQAAKKITVVKKPGAVPVPRTTKKPPPIDGLSLREMLKETTPRTRELMRKGDVRVVSMRKGRTGKTILTQTVTHHQNKIPTRYKQGIQNEDPIAQNFSRSRRIKVYCTCPRFKFAHDWTLHQEEASDLKFSTDEPSLITNPQQLHGVCKHLLKVLKTVIETGR